MLRVLGRVGLDGVSPLASRAHRVLLAALALDRPHPVPTDRLAHLVWGQDQPVHPAASLQNHVSRLRKLLPPDVRVVSSPDGYALDCPDDGVDAGRLEQAVRDSASAAGDRGPGVEPEAVLRLTAEALALWAGTPYLDLEDDDRATAEAVRLSGLRGVLQERHAESLVAAGRADEAVALLEAERRADPLRERTVELLMRAQVAAGRRSEALQSYQDLRRQVVDELGLDPSPRLRRLHADVVADRLAPPAPTIPPGPAAPARAVEAPPVPRPRPSVVPRPASTLFGREADLATARATVRGNRLTTLVGPGGVGKTRLALHLVDSLSEDPLGPDLRTTLVELAHLRDDQDVADLVASTLGAAHGSGASALDRVVAALQGGRHLLLLDNCEHLVEAAARLVDTVLTRTREVTVVATSREPLHVDGEHVLRLEPLDAAAAVALFTDRATAADASFRLDERTAPVVEQLCRALDGLPLALELAAARAGITGVQEVAAGLDRRFALLDRGRRTVASRHRSLRALVEWSVRDLDPELRTTFARLSVFAGPVEVGPAALVCDEAPDDVASRLADLADRSLLVVDRADDVVRYGFLETVRLYAADLLAASGEAASAGDRHAAWVLATVEAAVSGTASHDPTGGSLDRLAELRVAHRFLVATGDGDRALRLAARLHHLAMFRMQSEVFGWVDETAARFGDLDHPDAEAVLASACIGAWQSGDLVRAHALAARAVSVGERSRHPGAGAAGAGAMADVSLFEGDLARGLAQWERAVRLGSALPPGPRRVLDLADTAMVQSYAHEHERAARTIAQARSLLLPGRSWVSVWLDYAEGESLAETDPERALRLLDGALSGAAETGADFVTGVAGLTWAGLQVRLGRPAAATGVLLGLVRRWRRSGARVQQWITLRTVAEALLGLDDLVGAALVLGALEADAAVGHAAGPDQERLARLRAALLDRSPDTVDLLREGAAMPHEQLVDTVLEHLATRVTAG
jgi:predicted ATPase/DNA-binding SARP family transcriptional activator